MRILIALILVAALGWSAYWVVGARLLRGAIEDGIATMEARGVEIRTEEIRVTGFPNRFDTMVAAPRIAWPGGTAWRAPFLQVFALSYRPNQVIAAFPETQTLDTPAGEVRIGTARARASATFRAGAGKALDRSSLVAEEVRLTWAGAEARAARVLAATRIPEGAGPERQNIGLTLDDVVLPQGAVPGARPVDGLTLDAVLDLSAPLSLGAVERGEVVVERIEITRLDVDWGAMALAAEGTLDVAAERGAGGPGRGDADPVAAGAGDRRGGGPAAARPARHGGTGAVGAGGDDGPGRPADRHAGDPRRPDLARPGAARPRAAAVTDAAAEAIFRRKIGARLRRTARGSAAPADRGRDRTGWNG